MKNLFLSLSRSKKQLVAAIIDLVCFPAIFFLSLALQSKLQGGFTKNHLWLAIITATTGVVVFSSMGLYQAVIRYIDHKIAVTITGGATITACVLLLSMAIIDTQALDIKFAVVYWLFVTAYFLFTRFAARSYFNRRGENKVRVAIYGAGRAGSLLANAIKPGNEYSPVLFIDDDPQRVNTTICGIKVHHSSKLEKLAEAHGLKAVLLAMPQLGPREQRVILDRLARLSLKIKVTPPINTLVKGKARVEDVRQIEIEDLLSRDVVAPNPELLSVCITGKSVLVSGAGGSIGSELCRQIISLNPLRIVLLDISEYSLYAIEQELREYNSTQELGVEIIGFVGSVLDTEKCTRILAAFSVDTVYHAAAYKHVPVVEHNPIEGIHNNAFGTLSLATAAMAANVACFVLVSTDKAVRPTNVMGATKRLAELILQAFARRGTATRFSMVRFGNVLGSSGSVVPLFRKQIAAGGPITLTHPEITRYFMTIPEAAQLVIQAGAMGHGGDVFVLDMGDPVRIADLATRMIHLSGQEVKSPETPDGAIEIKYIGLRPGEKLYEELLIGDNVTGTDHPLIRRAQEKELEWDKLHSMLNLMSNACERFDYPEVRRLLLALVEEYNPAAEIEDHIWRRLASATAAKTAIMRNSEESRDLEESLAK